MAYSSVRVYFEIGHEASVRNKKTPEGFTHDWEVFVRGAENTEIQYFVEKVVFQLHETFQKPKRVVKEPPYCVKECGYAGFILPIEVYLKNKEEPKKITFQYDLQLQNSGPPISKVLREPRVFQNPSEDFRRKLIRGGGEGVDNPLKTSPKKPAASPKKIEDIKPAPVKKQKPDLPLSNSFADLFGTPIRRITSEAKKAPDVPKKPAEVEKKKTPIKPDERELSKDHVKVKEKDKVKKSSSPPIKPKEEFKKEERDRKKDDSNKSDKKERYKEKESEKSHKSEKKSKEEENAKKPVLDLVDKFRSQSSESPKEKHKHRHKKKEKEKSRDKEKHRHKDKEKDGRERNGEKKKRHEEVDKPRKISRSPSSTPPTDKRRQSRSSSRSRSRSRKVSLSPVRSKKASPDTSPSPPPVKKNKKKSPSPKREKVKRRSPSPAPVREKQRKRSHSPPVVAEKSRKGPLGALFNELSDSGSPLSEEEEEPIPALRSVEQLRSSENKFHPIADNVTKLSKESTSLKKSKPPKEENNKIKKQKTPKKRTGKDDSDVEAKRIKLEREKEKEREREREMSLEREREREREIEREREREAEIARKRKEEEEELAKKEREREAALLLQQSPKKSKKDKESRKRHKEKDNATPEPFKGDAEPSCLSEDRITQLRQLQQRITTLEDNADLQKVVELIAETGQYEVTKKTFDFDLCQLDVATLRRLQDFVASCTT